MQSTVPTSLSIDRSVNKSIVPGNLECSVKNRHYSKDILLRIKKSKVLLELQDISLQNPQILALLLCENEGLMHQ